ncbi:MAG TPA: 6,7-dimethyl-8-ribityllumazine synthase [Terriglobales bacterium]|nr:6,7-dimethyl-8-ribityllumazine synthase [Terriglobales bacterium]
MILSLHHLRVARSEREFSSVVELFESLGLEQCDAWNEKRSRGAKLRAPLGGIEIGHGRGFPDAELVLEVDSADAYFELAKNRKLRIVQKISDQEWGARLFILEAAGGMRVAVFSYEPKPEPTSNAGSLSAAGKRFGIVVARFNAFITERLLAGALDALRRSGAKKGDLEVVHVPGSFEIPIAARKLAASRRFNAIICLGCLLRGDTAHYDVIANECARGIGQSAQETGVPHAFGVLTCDTLEQAIDRAGLKGGNKGFEAALSAVEMANLKDIVGPRQSALGKAAKRRHRRH